MSDKKYIEVNAFIEKVNERLPRSAPDAWFDGTNDVLHQLKDEPPVDVQEVKHGEWICESHKAEGISSTWNKWYCSECKAVMKKGWSTEKDGKKPTMLYCGECGAKMDRKSSVRKVDCSMTEDEYHKGLNDLLEGMVEAAKSSMEKITCKDCKHCYKEVGTDWDMNSCWKYRCWRTGRAIPTDSDCSCRYAEKRIEE